MRLLPERHRLDWLGHPDQRVRLKAQFSLADPLHFRSLRHVALHDNRRLARLHAIWGVGQMARALPVSQFESELESLLPLLRDPDPEIRAHAAMLMGEGRLLVAQDQLRVLMRDSSPRVRFHALMAYRELFRGFRRGGQRYSIPFFTEVRSWLDRNIFGRPPAPRGGIDWPDQELVQVLVGNTGPEDPYLRHAVVMLLSEMVGLIIWPRLQRSGGVSHSLSNNLVNHQDPRVRMAVLLTMRRLGDAGIARYLADPDPLLVLEAARAIYDVPIPEALPTLAGWTNRTDFSAHPEWEGFILRRVLHANYRLGQQPNADALVRLAANDRLPEVLRSEALERLADWRQPTARDPVVGLWRPLPERSPDPAASALAPHLLRFQADPSETILLAATRAAADLNLPLPDPLQSLRATTLPPALRIQALQLLARHDDPRLPEAIDVALQDTHPPLRIAALDLQVRHQPQSALSTLRDLLQSGSLREQQAALRHLGQIDGADDLLEAWMDRFLAGEVPRELHLDVLEAARRRNSQPLQTRLARWEAGLDPNDPLASHRPALWGGDADAGRRVFHDRQDAACLRCHKIQGEGGEVGPDLTAIGSRLPREHLLESIVLPNNAIAQGYESTSILTRNGIAHAGVVVKETDTDIQISSLEDGTVTVSKSDIQRREPGLSAMLPELADILGPRDLRDLIAFLAGQK